MPRQGQSVETCILGQWYKEVGEVVVSGEPLFSYETDKASFEEEAKTDGFLLERYFNAGDEVPVLAEMAVIGEAGEVLPGRGENQEPEIPGKKEEESAKVVEFRMAPETLPGRISISPLARNMALAMGVDMASVEGSGPHGRIIARDVAAAGKNPALQGKHSTGEEQAEVPVPAAKTAGAEGGPIPGAGRPPVAGSVAEGGFVDKPVSHIRKLIAKAMHQSLQNSAQLTHHLSADARRLVAQRQMFKLAFESGSAKDNITINDLVCYAVIRALKKFPLANAHYLGDRIRYFSSVHLGVAVDTERGLMVPALQHADDLSLTGLSSRLRQVTGECRKGNINPDLLNPEAASFTVSNLGNYGVEMFTPVINLPQTAILGVCAIVPRPVDTGGGAYAIVPVIGLSLTYDHRALDGGEATRFLAEIRKRIEALEV